MKKQTGADARSNDERTRQDRVRTIRAGHTGLAPLGCQANPRYETLPQSRPGFRRIAPESPLKQCPVQDECLVVGRRHVQTSIRGRDEIGTSCGCEDEAISPGDAVEVRSAHYSSAARVHLAGPASLKDNHTPALGRKRRSDKAPGGAAANHSNVEEFCHQQSSRVRGANADVMLV